ncbi:MAG: sigma-E factor negative regulatory protein [Gammaproteobacteria bacterium]|nr:sigma-E factor negative regulatory protein [Gammaproteobacteria bacterium]
MMEKNADKVSLLIDGELDECDMSCVLRALKSDDAAGGRWRNYHLIRDAMQGSLPRHLPQGLAGRVMLSLEHEPIHINPHRHSSSPNSFRPQSRTRATLGFALAASLSAIAVFGVGVMELNSGSQQTAATRVASIAPPLPQQAVTVARIPQPGALVQLAAEAVPAKQPRSVTVLAAAARPVEHVAPRRSSVAVNDVSPAPTDLYDYLVNAHQYAPGAADTQAMLSYVQLVGYGSGR